MLKRRTPLMRHRSAEMPATSSHERKVVDLQERRVGRVPLRTYRTSVDIDRVLLDERQPWRVTDLDQSLQLDIEANEGLLEPLLVEPHPEQPQNFRVIDGGRRLASTRGLVDSGREKFRAVPIEVIDRTLTEDERLRVWVHLQRRQREWEAREKEAVAFQLVKQIGIAGAASILEMSTKEVEKLVAVYELSRNFTGLRDPGAAIVWARELMGISKKLLTPSVIEAVVKKANQRRITNSKDLRKLRQILPDPVARENFLSEAGDLESAVLRVPYVEKTPTGASSLTSKLEAVAAAMKTLPWPALANLKHDVTFGERLREVEMLSKELRERLEV